MPDIQDKITKLLRLSENNPSIEESAAAFAAAQRLATSHGLDLDSIGTRGEGWRAPDMQAVSQRYIEKSQRVPQWRSTLLHHITRANECGFYLSRNLGRRDGIQIYGQPRDLDAVEYLYRMACREVDRLVTTLAAGRGRRFVTGFRAGAASQIGKNIRAGLRQAMNAAPNQAADSSAALVVQSQLATYRDAVRKVVAEYENNLGLVRTRVTSVDAEGYSCGRVAANNVRVSSTRALSE